MKKSILFFLIAFNGICLVMKSQSAPYCPSVNAQAGTGPIATICQGQCANLTASVVPINLTDSYAVQSIPYSPFPFSGGTQVSVNVDDIWSDVINLPFSFCYFGNIYNDCIIGSNGQLSFDLSYANNYNAWPVTTPMPNSVDLPGNTICATFRDIDPSVSGTVFYYFTGTAPCRSLVIYWDDVALFNCDYPHSTFQMVLHETTNYIDVFIQNSSGSCTSWQGGGGIIGIQDASATLGYSPSGRNGGPWTANNEGWRFAATGAPTYSVSWSGPSGSIGSGLTANVCPSATTNYTATMTLSDCNAITSVYTSVVQVSVVPYPNLTVSSSNICQGASTTLNTSGASSYTWLPGNINGNSITVSPNATTIYTVSGTSGLGCVSTKTTSVTINPNPTITVNSGAICSGQSFTMNPSGASTYSYSSGSQVVNPTINSSYTVIGSSAAGCISTIGAISNVTIYTTPTISVNSGTICSGQSFTIIPSGANTYTYSSGSPIVSPLSNTSYVITGTSLDGCPSSGGAISNVIVNTTPVISVNSGAICSGQSFTILPSGANTYTYSSGTNIVNPLSNSSYTVIGSGIGGCIGSAAAISNVTVNPNPLITVNSGAICSGQSFTIIPNGANTYTYSSGSPIVNPSNTSAYIVTGTSLDGCVSSSGAVSNVTVNPNPTITVNSGAICSGQSFTITPNGATTYTYSSGSPIVSPLNTSAYIITGTSIDGCIGASAAISNVTVNPNPTITVNNGAICSGQSFTILPSGATTYTYSSGSPIVNPLNTSSYVITGTSSDGCVSASAAVSNVTVNPNPTITVNSGAICPGQGFTINPVGASTYSYSSGSPFVNPTTSASYTVTGTSSDGCVSSVGAISNVTVNTTPVISVNSGAICAGQSFTIIPNGATSYSYSSGSAVVNPLSSTSYTVIGTSANGCIGSGVAISNVTVNPNPVLSVNSGAICTGQNFTIIPSGANTYSYSSGSNVVNPTITSSYTVVGTSIDGCVSNVNAISNVTVNSTPTISVNSGAICNGQSFTITPSGAATYSYSGGSNIVNPSASVSYTVNGTSAEGCIAGAIAVSHVTVNPNPIIAVNSGAVCLGESFTITPTGADTYSFSSGSNVVSPSSTTGYTVTGASTAGCISSNVVISNVTVNPIPVLTVNSGSICLGQNFLIIPSGANTYTFSGGSNIVSPTITTSYTVTGTSAEGCTSPKAVVSNVVINANPLINADNGVMCGGQNTTQLSVTSLNTNLSYAWSGPSVVSGSNTPNPTVGALGVYTILVTDNGSSCTSSQTLSVNNASVIAQFTANPFTGPAPLNVGFINQSVGASNYSWNFGNGNSSALSPNNTYFTSGTYTVVLTALSGACTSTVSMEIKVLEPLGIIPELFTPNGDPFNPTFEIKGLDFYTNNSLEVFNRWGNPVYSAKPYKNDWDGTANAPGSMGSSKLPTGTYFYILNIGDEAKTIYRGYVQIEY